MYTLLSHIITIYWIIKGYCFAELLPNKYAEGGEVTWEAAKAEPGKWGCHLSACAV